MKALIKSTARTGLHLGGAALARARGLTSRPTRFAGAFRDRASALASLPKERRRGYDTDGIAEVSFDAMCRLAPWDYPVLFWLQKIGLEGRTLLDAGGHMGTNHIAFAPYLPLAGVNWNVLDTSAVIAEAKRRQISGALSAAIGFYDHAKDAPAADILLASGLLQYLDLTFADFLDGLASRPAAILLNKVATRDGGDLVTLERIGPARVPYRIRDRATFEAEIAATGYAIGDTWAIPALSHVIPTHPWLGSSVSRGYLLERRA